MTVDEMAKRIEELERGLAELRARVEQPIPDSQRRWWVDDAGRFAGDPVFDRIVQLGQRYRRSQRKPLANRHGRS